MKIQNKQILAMLYSFDQSEVLKAFDLYVAGIKDNFTLMKEQLEAEGWYPQKERPTDKEFYTFIDDEYWVQTPEIREKQIQAALKAHKEKQAKTPKQKKQDAGLKLSAIRCPKCNAKMYKQNVCTGCAEGKKGYKIRLICEENPDHEVLL